ELFVVHQGQAAVVGVIVERVAAVGDPPRVALRIARDDAAQPRVPLGVLLVGGVPELPGRPGSIWIVRAGCRGAEWGRLEESIVFNRGEHLFMLFLGFLKSSRCLVLAPLALDRIEVLVIRGRPERRRGSPRSVITRDISRASRGLTSRPSRAGTETA